MLLKAAFPVDVMSPAATFDVQWGNVERPTHRNTSWDWARFETCAHKWADLSEGNYGVALLNDCKYGYDIHDNVIRLTLLKSATNPDANADQGEHWMTYSLLPHEGDWRDRSHPGRLRPERPADPAARERRRCRRGARLAGVGRRAQRRDRDGQAGGRRQRRRSCACTRISASGAASRSAPGSRSRKSTAAICWKKTRRCSLFKGIR